MSLLTTTLLAALAAASQNDLPHHHHQKVLGALSISSHSKTPTPVPAECQNFGGCESVWKLVHKRYYALMTANFAFNMAGDAAVMGEYKDPIVEVDAGKLHFMECADTFFGKGWACDCWNNARTIFYLLTGARSEEIVVPFLSGYMRNTTQLGLHPNRLWLGPGNLFDDLIADLAVVENAAYLVKDQLGQPYHGFVIEKCNTNNGLRFLIYSAFAGSYRMMDWMNGFKYIFSLKKQLAFTRMNMKGTKHKTFNEIKDFLTKYKKAVDPMRADMDLNDPQRKAYDSLWECPGFVGVRGQDQPFLVWKQNVTKDGIAGRIEALERFTGCRRPNTGYSKFAWPETYSDCEWGKKEFPKILTHIISDD
ncbi:hypothetical protein AAMO2058_001462700 [Amorphochlora amoebiformis]